MKYKLDNEKEIDIPDKEIDNLVNILDITEEEAIETWLSDNDYEENEVVEKLTKKAKENKTTLVHAQTDKRERKPREVAPKEDKVKEDIINQVAKLLGSIADKVVITNKTKLIEFQLNGEDYKFDLIRRRKSKAK